MGNLSFITIAVNFGAMVIAIWLGIYVVTRSPRNPVAWLTGLTLLSVSGWFLNVLLAVNPPPSPATLPSWMTPLLWIWPAGLFQQGWGVWLQGWQVTPAIMFWHHATMLMRPGRMNAWRWSRVLLGYVIAIIAIYVQLNTDLMFTIGEGDPLYLNTLQQGKLYPLFMGFLIIYTILSLINLLRSAKIAPSLMPKRHLNILAVATLTAGLSGPTAFAAYILDIPLPRVVLSTLLGFSVLLMGYGVARYSALIERRILGRDLIYNGVAVFLVAVVYLMVGYISVTAYGVPVAALAFIVILAVITHSLVDVGRQALDFIFFQREARELRMKLRGLISLAGEPQALEESLSLALKVLCESVRATFGLILIFDSDTATQLVSHKWEEEAVKTGTSGLILDDVVQPEMGHETSPIGKAALIIPLYDGIKQVGVLILGSPENALRYAQSDIERLLELSDRISDLLHTLQREKEYLANLAEFTRTKRPALDTNIEIVSVAVVEDSLRNLHDFAHLGDCPLMKLIQVNEKLSSDNVTHLDRGKAVHDLLLSTLEKLRPLGEIPHEPIPREWFPFIILHEAYMNGVQNRDIMSKLYISEGTFNRIRRTAIRSLARAITEMEHST